MKYAPPIQLSALEPQYRQRNVETVDYLKGFWVQLSADCLKSILAWRRPPIKALVSTSVRFVSLSLKRVALLFKRWNSRPHRITVRFRWLWLAFWMIHFYPHVGSIVYADPISPAPSINLTKNLPLIKDPSYAPQMTVETMLHPLMPYGTYANDYAPGNCTLFVASRLPVPNSMGNADMWAIVLGGLGYTVSDTPKVGAIAVSTGDSYLGHVAIVESIDGGVVVSEENYEGYGIIDTRPANPGEFQYVYF